jgi:hypothetical protein
MSTKVLYSTENRLHELEEFIRRWSLFFRFFQDQQQQLQTGSELNDRFRLATRDIALRIYAISELAGDAFSDSNRILKLLSEMPSLEALKTIADSSYDKLQVEWHEIYLKLNVAKGKLLHRMTLKQLAAYEAEA